MFKKESTWQMHLRTIRSSASTLNQQQKNNLIEWCRKNVNSRVSDNASTTDIKKLMDLYDRVRANKMTTVLDETSSFTAFHQALRHGCDHLVIPFLQNQQALFIENITQAVNTLSPLHLSIIGGNEALVKLLLDFGAASSALHKNGQGLIPLHFTALCSTPNNRNEYESIAKLLLPYASPEDLLASIDKDTRETVLMSFMAYNNLDIITSIVEKGSTLLRKKDHRDYNCLHYAIEYHCSNDILDLLLTKEPSLKEGQLRSGDTIFLFACRHGTEANIEKIFSDTPVNENLNIVNTEHHTALDYVRERFPQSELINRLENLGAQSAYSSNQPR